MFFKKEVDIPIYYGKLVLIYTDSFEKVNKKYNTEIPDNALYDGVFFETTCGYKFVICLKTIKDWSLISHETVHAVNAIFLSCGVKLSRKNDEPQAYLHGWIMKQIEKFILEIKIN